MDVKRLILGVSGLVLLFGFLLLGLTSGGVFNKIVPSRSLNNSRQIDNY